MSSNEALIRVVIVAIIPARFGFTRLPGTPLSDICGKPLIQHLHACARLAHHVEPTLLMDAQPHSDSPADHGGFHQIQGVDCPPSTSS